MIKQHFSHIGLNCKDPLMIEEFYSKYFGFERARVYDPGPDQVVMIKSGGVYLELFRAKRPSPVGKPDKDGYTFPGMRHFCFQVESLDEALSELGSEVEVTLGPLDMSEFIPGMKVAWVADPEGNIVELNEGYKDEEGV